MRFLVKIEKLVDLLRFLSHLAEKISANFDPLTAEFTWLIFTCQNKIWWKTMFWSLGDAATSDFYTCQKITKAC